MEALPMHERSGVHWKGVAFLCPHCNTVLGAGLDPEAFISEIVKEIYRKEEPAALKFHI
jgi:hypothetical protein